VAACIAAYALSLIDLIPDFIPVLGYLDEVIILPLGIMLAVKLVPAELVAPLVPSCYSVIGNIHERFCSPLISPSSANTSGSSTKSNREMASARCAEANPAE
jgi:hypothetical protein